MGRLQTKAWVTIAALSLAVTAPAWAETASQVFTQVSPSVVVVVTYGASGKPTEQGSGVKLPNGDVATNCHVLKDGTTYRVHYQGKDYPAQLNRSDWNHDVCSLKVPGLPAPAVKLGNTKSLQIGATVYAIGAPEGLQLTLSQGIVSSLRPVGDGSYIQTTAAISPGSSGGGLFDSEGRLLGLTSFFVSQGEQLNFALPVEWIEALPKHTAQRIAQNTNEVDWLNRGVALKANKDWKGLLTLSQRWVKAAPGDEVAWLSLGAAYFKLGENRQAIEADRQVLQINPKVEDAWYLLGLAYAGVGQFAQAVEAERQALQINPKDPNAWGVLGLTYDLTGQYVQAIEAERQALQINPKDAQAWFGLGEAYDGGGKYAQAIEAYRQVLQINPKDTNTWNQLGWAYVGAGQYAQTIKAERQALQINPKDAGAWSFLGAGYEGAGQYAQAIEAERQALQISPRNAMAWYVLGLVYHDEGDVDQALDAYQRLKTLSPKLAQKLFDEIVPK